MDQWLLMIVLTNHLNMFKKKFKLSLMIVVEKLIILRPVKMILQCILPSSWWTVRIALTTFCANCKVMQKHFKSLLKYLDLFFFPRKNDFCVNRKHQYIEPNNCNFSRTRDSMSNEIIAYIGLLYLIVFHKNWV